ncbi:hypothetical protein [Streptomyces botrytidirepellens]|uniref:DNA-directed RNA polymerase specialized sigma24 family protein n=1 Tax=Streptomyces botrytidirepellens TaxID=2486417 RepID=A0A3M8VJS2_9ACTN|nr:hypothetical protein [Streptomyces botrytidirepellens]RNG17932.1 hypothetical protein EEJ42_28885 [Streptomyces botrytidirepellens]
MEQQQATATPDDDTDADTAGPIDVEQAEAAIVEHYPRLVRLAYLILPPGMGRTRRVLAAHALAQRALPRNQARPDTSEIELPWQRGTKGTAGDAGYAYVRLRVLRSALRAARPRRPWMLSAPLPLVWGLRLFPRSGGADELALDKALSELSGPGRAAYVLRELERMEDREVRALLQAAGVDADDALDALDEADEVPEPAGSRDDGSLLESAEFDPCSLQARPTDLMRRRQHLRALLVAVVALVVCGSLLGMPGEGWGPGGAAAPSYARNPSSERALDPERLTRAEPFAWRTATRADFSSWPARGDRLGDTALLRRALAVWARPGSSVRVSTSAGTQSGPPSGPPQLLYAGVVDQAAVVLLYDGLRVARYAEASGGEGGTVALDLARLDAADAAASTALVLGRTDGNVRYLTAPWVRRASVRDLLRPAGRPRPVRLTTDGVTDPVRTVPRLRPCRGWPAVRFGSRLVADLGELAPARLTYGGPGTTSRGGPRDVAGRDALLSWERTACRLPLMAGRGVRSVNIWRFGVQRLPERGGRAAWLCTRAETWRGAGSRVLAQFQPWTTRRGAAGMVAATADGSPACGPRAPRVLAGVLWKARSGRWFLLAAGSRQVTGITASGGVRGRSYHRALTVPAKPGAHATLKGRLRNGGHLSSLR